ncbi:hypothetical protein MKW98_007543 [Papaver atlanticum]|uniref:Uncharacterized protein n=1 Tax=Papaver atlanticum TaxID=357466 RepID=A0AAD4SBZ6_9MAGN|nr:hypothetical protein MKW98_007543 [Papaver atlanticum]
MNPNYTLDYRYFLLQGCSMVHKEQIFIQLDNLRKEVEIYSVGQPAKGGRNWLGSKLLVAEGLNKAHQDIKETMGELEYENFKPHQSLYSKKCNIEESIYEPASLFLVLRCRIQVAYDIGSWLFGRPTSSIGRCRYDDQSFKRSYAVEFQMFGFSML